MIREIYCTQRFYNACFRETFGANLTDTKASEISGNLFVGIPIVISDYIPDPPGVMGIDDRGMILYPKIVENEEE